MKFKPSLKVEGIIETIIFLNNLLKYISKTSMLYIHIHRKSRASNHNNFTKDLELHIQKQNLRSIKHFMQITSLIPATPMKTHIQMYN